MIGLICFLVALSLMLLTTAGLNFGRLPGVVGVMAMLVSIITFSTGVRTARQDDYDIVTRIIGVILPALAMVTLILLYFAGILFG